MKAVKRFTSSVTGRSDGQKDALSPSTATSTPRSSSVTTSPRYSLGALMPRPARSKSTGAGGCEGKEQVNGASSVAMTERDQVPVDVLEVTVHEGKALLSMDSGGKSDPYCILKMHRSGHSFKTKTRYKTLKPEWEEKFSVKTKNMSEGKIDDFLQVAVYDYDIVGQNDFMGHVDVPCSELVVDTPVTQWYDVTHPDDPSKPAGSLRLTLNRVVRYESESGVTRGLRKKMFATMMFTRMKLVEWEIEAELSVEILFGIFKMTMALAVEKGEQTLQEMELQATDAMREASNDPLDGEEDDQPPAFVDGEALSSTGSSYTDCSNGRSLGESEKSGMSPSSFDQSQSRSGRTSPASFRKKSTFDRTLEKSLSKLKSALQVSRAQFQERELTGSIGVGVVLGVAKMEIEIMVTMRITRSQRMLKSGDSRNSQQAHSDTNSDDSSSNEGTAYPKLSPSPSNSYSS